MISRAAVFATTLAYFLVFRHYGFQIEDEGTLLFQLGRAAAGQMPYIDFRTGYTPGYFYAGAWLLELAGRSTPMLRTFLALINATTATLLYGLARRIAGRWMALVPVLAWVLFIPVYRGDFAAFNVPYPAWLAALAFVATTTALVRWSERRSWLSLIVAGVCAAAAFAVKPNAGAYALAAGTWSIVLLARVREGADWTFARTAAVAMGFGVWFAFGFTVLSVDAVVHLLPCAAIVVLASGRFAGALSDEHSPRAGRALLVFALAFAVPTASWVVPVGARLGVEGFLREVLLIGSNAAALYYKAHPLPELYAVAVTAAVVLFALAGKMFAGGGLSPLLVVTPVAVTVLLVLTRIGVSALMPEGLRTSIVAQLENASFWLAPLANVGGIVLLARRLRTAPSSPQARWLAVCVPMAVAMYLQLYPRADFMHVAMSVPLTAVVATALLVRVAAWWSEGRWPAWLPGPMAVDAALVLVVALVVSLKLSLALEGPLRAAETNRGGTEGPRVTAWVESEAADDLVAFDKTVHYLESRTKPGERVLAFPAMTGALYAAELTSPVPHDYWYPGRPDHGDEHAMVTALAADPPRWVVTLNSGWTFFTASPAYFEETRRFVHDHYGLVARYGRFDVLGPSKIATEHLVDYWQPTGPLADAIEPDLAVRRQAARRWMAGLTVDAARDAELPASPRKALLLLRAVRDAHDMRGAGWLIAGYHSTHPLVRREAIDAMGQVTEDFRAGLSRWAGDFGLHDLRPFVRTYVDDAHEMVDDPDPKVAEFASTLLSITTGPLRAERRDDQSRSQS
jgi:hypothetical protein